MSRTPVQRGDERRSLPGQLRAWLDEPQVEPTPGPSRLDAVIVAVGWTGAVLETVLRPDVVWRPVAFVAAVVTIGVIPWRRRHGLATTVLAFGMASVLTLLTASHDDTFGLWSAALLLLFPYALFRWAPGRHAALGLLVCISTWAVSVATDFNGAGEAIAGFVFLMLPPALGALVRAQATIGVAQRERVRASEREGLARDLHDTVAHHLSAVAVQAQAGQALAATRPDAAVEALAVIEEEAARSLDELRSIVRSLRSSDPDGSPALAPQAGLADLERLGEVDRPGLVVDVEIVGPTDVVPERVAGALHRIAQESLTNVVRHASGARRANVRVHIDVSSAAGLGGVAPEAGRLVPRRAQRDGDVSTVVLTIDDDGATTTRSARAASGGFGIVGMRERAELLGGRLDAGPRPGGGWSVRCVLPLGAPR